MVRGLSQGSGEGGAESREEGEEGGREGGPGEPSRSTERSCGRDCSCAAPPLECAGERGPRRTRHEQGGRSSAVYSVQQAWIDVLVFQHSPRQGKYYHGRFIRHLYGFNIEEKAYFRITPTRYF